MLPPPEVGAFPGTSVLDVGAVRPGDGQVRRTPAHNKIFGRKLRRLLFFFWREKSGPGRRIEHPIEQLKCAKHPNPTLQPCWVHPTKSQNSLQEVDCKLKSGSKTAHFDAFWRLYGAKKKKAPKWRHFIGGGFGHFGGKTCDLDLKI